MKHLLTAIACFFALSLSAQFPYNPDSDGDNMIGMDDFLNFLPLFGQPITPSFTLQKQVCDADSINGSSPCVISEETDWLSVHNVEANEQNLSFVLPIATTWKKLCVALDDKPDGMFFHASNNEISYVNWNGYYGTAAGPNPLMRFTPGYLERRQWWRLIGQWSMIT
jgi:hypothetical protein